MKYNMDKIIFIILSLLVFVSCRETVYKESNFVFQLPQKNAFIKTSKRPGGKFVVFFAQDSLSLNSSKDSIEFRTRVNPIIMIVDEADIYLKTRYSLGIEDTGNGNYQYVAVAFPPDIESMGNNNFNIEVIPDSVFDSFLKDNIQKLPYSLISIDTKEYSIFVNQQQIKKGNICGGW